MSERERGREREMRGFMGLEKMTQKQREQSPAQLGEDENG